MISFTVSESLTIESKLPVRPNKYMYILLLAKAGHISGTNNNVNAKSMLTFKME